MLNEDLVKKLNGISTRLDNLYKVVIDQDKEIKEGNYPLTTGK